MHLQVGKGSRGLVWAVEKRESCWAARRGAQGSQRLVCSVQMQARLQREGRGEGTVAVQAFRARAGRSQEAGKLRRPRRRDDENPFAWTKADARMAR